MAGSLEMMKTAKMAVEVCAAVALGENVCVVTDTKKTKIAEALALASREVGAETVLLIMAPRKMHGNEPPKAVAAAMKMADAIFAPTTFSITHTKARIDASRMGARTIIMRGITEDMMIHGAMTADYMAIKEKTKKLADRLSASSTVHVTSDRGTNVKMSLRKRKALILSGFATEAGEFAALPDGEAAIAPVEGSAKGTIVFDHTMDGIGLLKQPIALKVREGKVIDIQGGEEAKKLKEIVYAADQNAVNIAEFAIGTNPKARLIGNMAEDKKKIGSVHVAIGDNHTIGGNIESSIHLDGLMIAPTVELDGERVVERGKLLLAS